MSFYGGWSLLNEVWLILSLTDNDQSYLGQNPDPEELEEMVDEVDADGSGSINFPEFIELMLKRQQGGQTKEEIKQAFRVFDKDGNGYVSSSELKFVMSRWVILFFQTIIYCFFKFFPPFSEYHQFYSKFESK